MEQIITTLINGLSAGGTYAMIALGYTMVYGIAKMLNFAHGDVIMVGAYALFVMFTTTGNPLLGLVVAVVLCVIFGVTIERLAYRPLRGASPLAVLITAIGVSSLLQALAQMIFGAGEKKPVFYQFGNVTIFGISISLLTLITLIASAIIMVVLSLFVKYTRTGRAMIAVSEDRGAAELMGISVNKIIVITFAIGSALAAVAGFFMVWKAPNVTPILGAMPGIKAFAAAVIGGIGSLPGAMLGGILMGVVESFSSSNTYTAPYTDAIVFAVLILILLVRPSGLLGKKRREKV
ncbi:MAG: branched-chain amino acid ABC transporter permease [Ruminococcaceae bacterium]|nr:branched-chain amino acid ABC transporter permease [Oscillospiraceae bacterium]